METTFCSFFFVVASVQYNPFDGHMCNKEGIIFDEDGAVVGLDEDLMDEEEEDGSSSAGSDDDGDDDESTDFDDDDDGVITELAIQLIASH